jgi:hypothetical protein
MAERHHSTSERKSATRTLAALRGKGETPEQLVNLAIGDVRAAHEHGALVAVDMAMVLVEEIERLRYLLGE